MIGFQRNRRKVGCDSKRNFTNENFFEVENSCRHTPEMVTKRCESRHARQRSLSTVNEMIFEVGNVLLRTLRVKRNAGMGTPAEYLLILS